MRNDNDTNNEDTNMHDYDHKPQHWERKPVGHEGILQRESQHMAVRMEKRDMISRHAMEETEQKWLHVAERICFYFRCFTFCFIASYFG